MLFCTAVETATTPAAGLDSAQVLAGAGLSQAGRKLVFTVRTTRPIALSRLLPLADPRRASSRYLCLTLQRAGNAGQRRICLGGKRARHRVGVAIVNARGATTRTSKLAATVSRPSPERLVVAILPDEAGLAPARYRWRAIESNGCGRGEQCAERLPKQAPRVFRLRPVRPVGCQTGTGEVRNGPRDGKAVALTFDDGPSALTPEFLRVLREKDAVGTFFQVGQEMPGREATMRDILAAGSELADHTMNHVNYPGYSQIADAAARTAEYTHFRPCLFRPPSGAVDGAVLSSAASLGMRTVLWDVDPSDWTNPGSAAVYSRIVGAARPGSIILMHDGGGPRNGTLEALPRIIDTLRSRGYRFKTVTELLGGKTQYQPYG